MGHLNRVVVQQGQGRGYRGTSVARSVGSAADPNSIICHNCGMGGHCMQWLRCGRQDQKQAEQWLPGEEQRVWRNGKGHNEEVLLTSQDYPAQRRRLL